MPNQIILLRGVMPMGKNKVPMALLRAALEKAGLRNVRTYIQSGNVVVSTQLKPPAVERLVHDVIQKEFGGDLAVVVRTLPQFRKILALNPFAEADRSRLYITFFSTRPDKTLLEPLLEMDAAPDQIEVIGDAAYLLVATKYSDTKLHNNFLERRLKVPSTTRIYNTAVKLLALAESTP